MKKVINGRLYDTNTAIEIGSWENGANYMDVNYVIETLYKTHNGEYFLYAFGYAFGGPNNIYANRCGFNGKCSGSMIALLTEDEARKFAEEKLTADEYLSEFKLQNEDEEEPWYVEKWYDADIEDALKSGGYDINEENVAYVKKHITHIFDDKSDRNERLEKEVSYILNERDS